MEFFPCAPTQVGLLSPITTLFPASCNVTSNKYFSKGNNIEKVEIVIGK